MRVGCRGWWGKRWAGSRGKPKEGSVGNGGNLNEMLPVAEDGRLVRRTATGLRSPHARVTQAASGTQGGQQHAVCAQWSPGMVLSVGALEESPPQAFLSPFLLQKPFYDLRGKASFFSLTLTLTLFYPSAFLVNRLSALSLDDSYLSFYPGMPSGHAGWFSWSFSFCCGPLSFCLPGCPSPAPTPPRPRSR